jgi:hypothetical protein
VTHEAPKAGTPEWHAQRAAEMKRHAERMRYRKPLRTLREHPRITELRAEMNRVFIAGTTANGDEAERLAARGFELQQAIRAEQEHASPIPRPYAATARTAASSRVPGEDDE